MTERFNGPKLDELARKLADSVPGNIKSMGEDMERNFKSMLQSALARMDLVTREEFDVQLAVLARTREKLEALEARLAALEESAPD
ncbi:MAG: accessory factor UbiK family protein [Rhodospirillaceae bacterium]|nr:accessory factor UbiK family protein [Rhodospirillaceae bacterium]MYF71523.1 accessory factor UbiK family protein [Pseudomonadota bacterium]MYJ97261.1 accessory factor UbiK family protein [Pseudomonadota bacterium]